MVAGKTYHKLLLSIEAGEGGDAYGEMTFGKD